MKWVRKYTFSARFGHTCCLCAARWNEGFRVIYGVQKWLKETFTKTHGFEKKNREILV